MRERTWGSRARPGPRLQMAEASWEGEPLLLAQLHDWGIEISAGQLNRLLTEGHDAFHQEKAEIKTAGLATSTYIQADDTGARHQGQNGYCTYIGNERFAWFASTDSKSRVNFLELLQTERCYAVNAEALAYMAERGLAKPAASASAS